MKPASETRNHILSIAYGLFYREGFARVGVDAIAEAAGITKRTLYNHFDSKDTLVAAVLEQQHTQVLVQIRGWADADAATAAEFLSSLFRSLEAWAEQPRWLGSGYTRLTMELADRPGHPARRAAQRHKAAVEQWLGAEFNRLSMEEPAELARQVMLLVEGCLSLMLIHGDRSYAATAARAALLLAQTSPAVAEWPEDG